MDFRVLLNNLLPVVGQAGIKALTDQLHALSGDAKPWQKPILRLLSEALEAHGPAGIILVQKALSDMAEDRVPKIDWANPRTASDIVAALQNAEADEKSAAQDFLTQVGNTLGLVLAAMVKSIVAGI